MILRASTSLHTLLACLLALLFSHGTLAQETQEPNTVILVAAPNLAEPVYRQTVLIVTAIEGGRFIGVVGDQEIYGGMLRSTLAP